MLHRCKMKNDRSIAMETESSFKSVKGFASGRSWVLGATCRVLEPNAENSRYARPRAQMNRRTLWTSRVSRCACHSRLGFVVLREWWGPGEHGFDSLTDHSEARHGRLAASPKILSTNQQLMIILFSYPKQKWPHGFKKLGKEYKIIYLENWTMSK